MCIRDRSIGITDTQIREIKEYLSALELIVNCPIETADPGAKSVEHILFTQPGMRYCQAQALVPVSYTHLDVYKRQIINIMPSGTNTWSSGFWRMNDISGWMAIPSW